DRFQLKTHREMREIPIYALIVSKTGPKLDLPANGLCAEAAKGDRNPSTLGSFGGPARQMASCKPVTSMDQLALNLSRDTDRSVVNQTKIEGGQMFELRWAGDGLASQSNPLPSLFTALQEQLGLRLEPSKQSVEVLVIDSIQKPSEN